MNEKIAKLPLDTQLLIDTYGAVRLPIRFIWKAKLYGR
jgi:hypothetical protein